MAHVGVGVVLTNPEAQEGFHIPNSPSATALAQLIERRDGLDDELCAILYDNPRARHYRDKKAKQNLTNHQLDRAEKLSDEIEEVDEAITRESDKVNQVRTLAEARMRDGVIVDDRSQVSVSGERMIYGTGAENSWWKDFVTVSHGPADPNYGAAQHRQAVWGAQVETEIAGGSEFGREAVAQLREQFRDKEQIVAAQLLAEARDRGRYSLENKSESRAVGTGGGPTVTDVASSASSFVTPVFVGPYVPFRQYGRSFADQAAHPPMPDYGMGIFKPVITAAAGVAAFTEDPIGGSAVTEVDPYAGYLSGSLGIYAGQVTLSQAVLDRTAPDFRYDVAVEDQIQRAEAPELDAYVLGKALANAGIIAFNGTFTLSVVSGTGGFTGAVGQAKKTMRKTVGTVLNPTHLFMDPAPWEYIENWSDANGRPVVVPNYAGPFNAIGAGSADGDAGIEGATGYKVNALQAFTDANIPLVGGTANLYQALVCNMQEIEFYEGKAYNRILPQTNATYLQTIVQRYKYVTVLVNYNAAVQAIQGTAWGTINW